MHIAIVHDYLTQRGGAERVVLALHAAFPDAPIYTSLFDRDGTFPEFADADVRTLWIDQVRPMRKHHRLALPVLAPSFSRLRVDADIAICSSSGWAHGASVRGRKVVYCHTPARWLYQGERYLRGSDLPTRAMLAALRSALVRWDRAAAASASRYLVNSAAVRERVQSLYGIDAEVVSAPHAADPAGASRPLDSLESGFLLCVSRLLPYKNVGALLGALELLPAERMVVVGDGPERGRLERSAPRNVTFVGTVDDEVLRWLYANSVALLSASYEDYGLTPLEAAAFGRPSVVLHFGGFLDTVESGTTGIFFDRPEPAAIADAIRVMQSRTWFEDAIRAHAEKHSQRAFVERMRATVEAEFQLLRGG